MLNHLAIMNNTGVTARHESARVLYARASEYRRMATSASTVADAQALDDLTVRFAALAAERDFEERMARHETEPLNCLPSPQALRIATDATRRRYTYPETILHPVVARSIRRLAYELMAYGLVPPEPAPVVAEPSKPPAVAQHVLVADDSADVLVAVSAFLLGEGFVVVSAPDGDTALRLIASDPQIGVLITDFVMPGLSGVELIAQAVSMRPELKALLITAYPNANGLSELPSHIKILTKPFRRAALITKVQNLIREAPPVRSDEALELVENTQVRHAVLAAGRAGTERGDRVSKLGEASEKITGCRSLLLAQRSSESTPFHHLNQGLRSRRSAASAA